MNLPLMNGSFNKPIDIKIKKKRYRRRVVVVPNFEIDFASDLINKQACQLQLINGNYKSDISSARTFGFEKDVNYLRKNGLALGGSLKNAVVIGENKILNEQLIGKEMSHEPAFGDTVFEILKQNNK